MATMPTVAGMDDRSRATPDASVAENGGGHRPVLLHPLIESLQPRPGHIAVDGTLGGGGVTAALIERVLPGGRVIAIDRDPAAVARGRERFAGYGDAVSVVHGDFADLSQILRDLGVAAVDAVTLDLGVSSLQLDAPERGFSFRFDGPLDMRMDTESGGVTAADVVNTWSASDLERLIREYGEERFARGVAASIVRE